MKLIHWMLVATTLFFMIYALVTGHIDDSTPATSLTPPASVMPSAFCLAAFHVCYLTRSKRPSRAAVALILIVWALIPPVFFALEWIWVFKGKSTGEVFESFKYSQELSTRFWFAILVTLGLLGQRRLDQR